MTAAILAFTEKGLTVGALVRSYLNRSFDEVTLDRCAQGGLQDWTGCAWNRSSALVFIGSCGIAVRAIAPHVAHKAKDPAVLVVDEGKSFAVALLSGHIGGANELAKELGEALGAVAVITTATDVRGVFAVDVWATKNGFAMRNKENIKRVSSKLLHGEPVVIASEYPVVGDPPRGVCVHRGIAGDADVLVSHRTVSEEAALQLVPRVLCAGIGCKKGTTLAAIESAFALALGENGLCAEAVKRVASIDLKANEPGLLEFCSAHALEFDTFCAQELMRVQGEFVASSFVREVTGADNVSERSAMACAGESAMLVGRRIAAGGVTIAFALMPYEIVFSQEE